MSGLIIGSGIFAGTGFLVVWLSALFSSNDGSKSPPRDYDNRWPGYPLRPGEVGYNSRFKGAFGNLPAQYIVGDGTGFWQKEWMYER